MATFLTCHGGLMWMTCEQIVGGRSQLTRKRLWEAGTATVLLLVLAVCGGALLYVRHINDAFAVTLARGDSEAAFALLRKGADIRAGMIPGHDRHVLFVAARSGNPDFVQFVLDHGADVNTRRSDGHTPLMAAAMSNQVESIRLLLRRGADVNAADDQGITALHYAVGGNKMKAAIDTLISAGAKVDCQDKTGRTPLMHVAKMGQADMVRVLLGRGADPSLKNKAGNTALALAEQVHSGRDSKADPTGVIWLLRQRGVKFRAR